MVPCPLAPQWVDWFRKSLSSSYAYTMCISGYALLQVIHCIHSLLVYPMKWLDRVDSLYPANYMDLRTHPFTVLWQPPLHPPEHDRVWKWWSDNLNLWLVWLFGKRTVKLYPGAFILSFGFYSKFSEEQQIGWFAWIGMNTFTLWINAHRHSIVTIFHRHLFIIYECAAEAAFWATQQRIAITWWLK